MTGLLLLPFKAVGWLAWVIIGTAIRTLAVVATVALVLAAIYWFGMVRGG